MDAPLRPTALSSIAAHCTRRRPCRLADRLLLENACRATETCRDDIAAIRTKKTACESADTCSAVLPRSTSRRRPCVLRGV